jgi:hypothetical protein
MNCFYCGTPLQIHKQVLIGVDAEYCSQSCMEKDAADLVIGNGIVAAATLSDLNAIRLGVALQAEPALIAPINIRPGPVTDEE